MMRINLFQDISARSSASSMRQRVIVDAGVMTQPLLLFSAGDDSVVAATPMNVSSSGRGNLKNVALPGARHAIFHDLSREEVCVAIRRFVAAQRDGLPASSRGDERGPTKYEYDTLRQPLPSLSAKGLWFAAQRAAMATLGRTSEGIALGFRTGFDSGSRWTTFIKTARGAAPLGKIIDRAFLDAIGWRHPATPRVAPRRAPAWRRRARPRSRCVADIAGRSGPLSSRPARLAGGRFLRDLPRS
jgi:hypothetical protein